MTPIQQLASFIVFLGALVFIHELGHFLVAKLLNVKVLRFSIGFGPRIFGFTRGETEYRVAWIPLGGYVKMAGEQPYEELSPEEAKRGFLAQPPWKRSLIVLAGPAFNLIFPILAYFFVFLGPEVSSRVWAVEPGMPAAVAGIEPGDRIVRVDDKEVRTFRDLQRALAGSYDQEISITLDRDGRSISTKITPARATETNVIETVTRGRIGVSPVPRPPIIGVSAGSPAEAAGLRTFDRIVAINGRPVANEIELAKVLDEVSGALRIQVARTEPKPIAGLTVQVPSLVSVELTEGEGAGLSALGLERSNLYVWSVSAGSPAALAGLRSGDRLVSINGKELRSFTAFEDALAAFGEKPFTVTWRSGSELKTQELKQVKVPILDGGREIAQVLDVGIRRRHGFSESLEPQFRTLEVSKPDTVNLGVVAALAESANVVPEVIRQTAIAIARLLTGSLPLDSVGSPLMIWQIATEGAKQGADAYMSRMALLSVNLGLMNLLPIPILDGFHLLAAVWEGIRRRPIPTRAREVANMVGLALLLLLMLIALKNDISKMM